MIRDHRCKEAEEFDKIKGKTASLVTWDEERGWHLFYDYETHQIVRCPYCGVLLPDPPSDS